MKEVRRDANRVVTFNQSGLSIWGFVLSEISSDHMALELYHQNSHLFYSSQKCKNLKIESICHLLCRFFDFKRIF